MKRYPTIPLEKYREFPVEEMRQRLNDFYEDIDKRGFKFDNPNAVKTCGCGESFQA